MSLFKYVETVKTIKWLYNNRDKLNTDILLQRNMVWSNLQASNLIVSVLESVPIPNILLESVSDGSYNVIDGKNRLGSIFAFLDSKISIHPQVKIAEFKVPYSKETFDITNKKFVDFPESLQDVIFDRALHIQICDEMDERSRKMLFGFWNSGSELKKIEVSRAKLSDEWLEYFEEITNHTFLVNKASIGLGERKRFSDFSIVLQIIQLLYNEDTNLSNSTLDKLIQDINEEGLSDEIKLVLQETLDKLNMAIPIKDKSLRKVHIPILFLVARQSIKDNISYEQLGGWWQDFSMNMPKKYADACTSGTTSRSSISTRIEEMFNHYNANIHNAERYDVTKANRFQSKFLQNIDNTEMDNED